MLVKQLRVNKLEKYRNTFGNLNGGLFCIIRQWKLFAVGQFNFNWHMHTAQAATRNCERCSPSTNQQRANVFHTNTCP